MNSLREIFISKKLLTIENEKEEEEEKEGALLQRRKYKITTDLFVCKSENVAHATTLLLLLLLFTLSLVRRTDS